MSYGYPAAPAAPPARPMRPTTVTTAGYLLYAVAGLIVANAVITLATYSRVMHAANEVYPPLKDGQTTIDALRAILIASIVVDLVIAGLFVLLAVFDMRGVNGMRITTWVIGGLGVLCLGSGAVLGGVSNSVNSGGDPQERAAEQHVADATAGVPHALSIVVSILALLALIVVIILLAVPASNAFFRARKQAMVQPPYPTGPAYPSYPSYPSYPTYPAEGSAPGATAPPAQPPSQSGPEAGGTAPPPPTDETGAGGDRPDGPR